MTNPIRHIAGPYEEGVQQCTRCLEIIVDMREWFQFAIKRSILLLGYREGPMYFVDGKWYEYIVVTQKPYPEYEVQDCQPMEAGL